MTEPTHSFAGLGAAAQAFAQSWFDHQLGRAPEPLEEAVALALANYDAALVDVPLIATIDDFRFDADRNEYLGRARAVLAAIARQTGGAA